MRPVSEAFSPVVVHSRMIASATVSDMRQPIVITKLRSSVAAMPGSPSRQSSQLQRKKTTQPNA